MRAEIQSPVWMWSSREAVPSLRRRVGVGRGVLGEGSAGAGGEGSLGPRKQGLRLLEPDVWLKGLITATCVWQAWEKPSSYSSGTSGVLALSGWQLQRDTHHFSGPQFLLSKKRQAQLLSCSRGITGLWGAALARQSAGSQVRIKRFPQESLSFPSGGTLYGSREEKGSRSDNRMDYRDGHLLAISAEEGCSDVLKNNGHPAFSTMRTFGKHRDRGWRYKSSVFPSHTSDDTARDGKPGGSALQVRECRSWAHRDHHMPDPKPINGTSRRKKSVSNINLFFAPKSVPLYKCLLYYLVYLGYHHVSVPLTPWAPPQCVWVMEAL